MLHDRGEKGVHIEANIGIFYSLVNITYISPVMEYPSSLGSSSTIMGGPGILLFGACTGTSAMVRMQNANEDEKPIQFNSIPALTEPSTRKNQNE
jgi:hypothetical protein